MGVKKIMLVVGVIILGLVIAWIFSPPFTTVPAVHDGWFGKGRIRSQDDITIRPFKVEVQDDVLEDLYDRLQKARFPDQLEEPQFQYGFRQTYLAEVVHYWKEEYDWRKHEAVLNTFPQYLTQIEGIDVHFIHVKPSGSAGKKAIMITHGWPGSVWEFYKLIPRLTEPEKFGGRTEDALEVICPSIPGYGFSEAPHHTGFSQVAAARVLKKLMIRLSHNKFYIQGGDWGSVISIAMAQLYPNHVVGVHLNMQPLPLMDPLIIVHQIVASIAPSLFMEESDRKLLKQMGNFGNILQESGYMHIQATKPDTVGTALNDSPIGLAAYILEKFSTWTDPAFINLPDGGITKKFTLDELLTNVMIYWTTGTITSSQRFYKEYFSDEKVQILDRIPVYVPTGIAVFPNELFSAPKAFLSYKYKNIVQYTAMSDGGHFAAFEEPKLLADDILTFVTKVEETKKL